MSLWRNRVPLSFFIVESSIRTWYGSALLAAGVDVVGVGVCGDVDQPVAVCAVVIPFDLIVFCLLFLVVKIWFGFCDFLLMVLCRGCGD